MSLAAHMLAHCALVAVLAPLVVLARPVNRVLELFSPARRERTLRWLASRPIALLTSPPVAWSSFVATQLAFHVTGLYDSALDDPLVDAVAHVLYVSTALLFWEVAIGSALPRRLTGLGPALYLLLAMPVVDLSAAWLMANGEAGAGAAMVAGMTPLGVAAALSAWRFARAEEARAGLEGTT